MSTVSSVVELLLSVFRFFSDIFYRRRDEKDELKRLIEEKQAELDLAIDEGRITDIEIIRRQLSELKRRYQSKRGDGASRSAVPFILAVALLSQGCFSTKHGQKEPAVIMVGERVMVVQAGDVVPELIPPAKSWYLVDSEAMKSWLNVTWSLDRPEDAK